FILVFRARLDGLSRGRLCRGQGGHEARNTWGKFREQAALFARLAGRAQYAPRVTAERLAEGLRVGALLNGQRATELPLEQCQGFVRGQSLQNDFARVAEEAALRRGRDESAVRRDVQKVLGLLPRYLNVVEQYERVDVLKLIANLRLGRLERGGVLVDGVEERAEQVVC